MDTDGHGFEKLTEAVIGSAFEKSSGAADFWMKGEVTVPLTAVTGKWSVVAGVLGKL